MLDPRNALSPGLQQECLTFLCLVAHLEKKLVTGAASQAPTGSQKVPCAAINSSKVLRHLDIGFCCFMKLLVI